MLLFSGNISFGDFREPFVDRYTLLTNGRRQGPRHPLESGVFRRHICRQTRWPASPKKATLQAAINPRNRSLPQRNQPHRETTTLNSRENIFRREPAYVSAAPFQFPRGSRPPLHEGKYLPETDTTCGKQYALGGIQ